MSADGEPFDLPPMELLANGAVKKFVYIVDEKSYAEINDECTWRIDGDGSLIVESHIPAPPVTDLQGFVDHWISRFRGETILQDRFLILEARPGTLRLGVPHSDGPSSNYRRVSS